MFLMLPGSNHHQRQSPKAEAASERQPPADSKFRRWLSNIWKRRWVKWGAVVLAITLSVLASRRPKLPGALGAVAAEVRVGMSRDEVASVIRRSYAARGQYDSPRLYTRGARGDGTTFRSYFDWNFTELPPDDLIAWGEFDINDDRCRDLVITFGTGGAVTAVRLESASIWEELRYGLSEGTGWSGWRSLTRKRYQCSESIVLDFFDPD